MTVPVRRPLVRTRLRRLLASGGAAALGITALSALQATPAQALTLPSQCLTSGITVTCTFTTPGMAVDFLVPAGVTSMHVRTVGERGGSATFNGSVLALGGAPHVVQGTVSVTEGDLIGVKLRQDGGSAGPGSEGWVAGRGGHSVYVARQTLIVAHAAGGGGAGATEHAPGDSSNGGSAGQPGLVGDYSSSSGNAPATGGQPGQQGAGGTGGAGGSIDACGIGVPVFYPGGQAGSLDKGGNGGSAGGGGYGGGGGGGGRYGGGGGGAGGLGCYSYAYAGGGGGGSSTVMPGGLLSHASLTDATYRAVLTFSLARRSTHTPAAMSFGNTPVGTQSAFQTFTLSNTGSAPLSVGSGVFGGTGAAQFAKGVDNCSGKTIADGTSCTVQLAFKPTVAGASSATFTLPDNSPQSPHTITLNGNGTLPVALLQVSNVSFGSREVGGFTDRQVVLGNFGNAPLNVASATLGGTNASDFTKVADLCSGKSLAVNTTCAVTVRFTAGAVGNRTGSLTFSHNANPTTSVANLSGIGTPPADLKILGPGYLHTGRDHLVTRTVTGTGVLVTYPMVILNEDKVARTYKLALTKTGPGASAEVWTTGFGAKALPKDPAGNYVTASVLPGKTVAYNLRVIPTAPGQNINSVAVALLSDLGGLIEGVTTQTNTPAPAKGTSSWELLVKQGGQPFIGGPVSGQTATAPAVNVGGSAVFQLRLRNDGTTSQRIGLRLVDVDACPGAFAVTATAAGVSQTTAVFNGTYLTPLRAPGQFTDVNVTIKRVASGCPSKTIRAESLSNGTVVRSSFLLANVPYNAVTD